MPFSCRFDGGRLVVTPSAERSYPILGQREQRPITACHRGSRDSCRTMMIHRFAIACGGRRVSWVRVVDAIRSINKGRFWLESGQLQVALQSGVAAQQSAPCVPSSIALRQGSISAGTGATRAECSPTRGAVPGNDRIVLPRGFAPVGELGARLQLAGLGAKREGRAQPALVEQSIAVTPQQLSAATTSLARDRLIVTAPLPEVQQGSTATAEAEAAQSWVTVVRAQPDNGSADGGGIRRGLHLAFALLAMAALGWLAWAFRSKLPPALLASVPSDVARWWATLVKGLERLWEMRLKLQRRAAGASADVSLANAADQVAALLEQTRQAVLAIKSAAALREVLEGELRAVGNRLAGLRAQVNEEGEAARKAAGAARVLIRELERIRRIADSAVASLTGQREGASVPRTRSEAFDLLGINPDVSEAITKKLVDALRASWHPDRARDEDDRLLREDRIKQINIAWELINGKRQAA